MTEDIIKIDNLTKKYNIYASEGDRFKEVISIRKKKYHKDFYALKDISFSVKKGETIGIIGTNGSGKSTLLKIITDVLEPSEGKVAVHGNVSALLELGTGFNMEYTGRQNIYLSGRIMGYSKEHMQERITDILDFAEIGDFIDQPVKNYSSGMFARLAFAVSINVNPDILIVDEALSVGDVFFQNKCFKKFEELKNDGVTIIFVSHDISSVRQMCSRVLWIEKGKQIIYDNADIVCDMYMDMKRKDMNMNIMLGEDGANNDEIAVTGIVNENLIVPAMKPYETQFDTNKLEIRACYFTDEENLITSHCTVDRIYKTHIVIEFYEDMNNLIVGIVLENQKGIPLYDINNYINQQQTISGKKGDLLEIVYEHKMPRLMKGMYVLSVAVAEGTQEKNMMHTWLHGVGIVEIVNNGYNSSYIEIPAKIELYKRDKDSIKVI